MNIVKRKKSGGIESIKRRYGNYFIAPWIFGVVVFVLIPLVTCFYYSLSDTLISEDGIDITFVGLKQYRVLFGENAAYLNQILESLSGLFKSMPIVVALSMILALILNQKFKGRLLARAVFFLPVIIASGSIMNVVSGSQFGMQQEMMASSGMGSGSEYMQIIDFSALLHRLNLPENINGLIAGYLSDTFNLVWSCGIQILLFVAGLQTIPAQLYEAGRVEGITAWEEFWYITVPMMGRVIMLVMFYTMVELFITKSSVINGQYGVIYNLKNAQYSMSSAMLWPYFALVALVIGAVILIYHKLCLKKWE